MERIKEALSVIVIGLHIPENPIDDPSLFDLLTAMEDRARSDRLTIEYISLSDTDLAQASGRGFTPRKQGFKDWVREK